MREKNFVYKKKDILRKILEKIEKFHFSGLFIIDDKGVLRQITINDLPVGRSVDEVRINFFVEMGLYNLIHIKNSNP